MITRAQLELRPIVRCLKYGTKEKVLRTCIMKDSAKGWIEAVIYVGEDRKNKGEMQTFCKEINAFMEEFEVW